MCMMSDDGESYVIYRKKPDVLAAKDHRCTECSRTINAGERYLWATGLYDGRWDVHHICGHCVQVTRWLEAVCEGWLHSVVLEDLAEHVTGHEDELRTRWNTRLLRWANAKWVDRNGELRSIESVRDVADLGIAAYERQLEAAIA